LHPAVPVLVLHPLLSVVTGFGRDASDTVVECLGRLGAPLGPAVTGTVALNADGTVNSAASKVTIDLRMLKSDQEMRDGYLQKRTLETDKFPTAVFVPKTLTGVASPFPNNGQAGSS